MYITLFFCSLQWWTVTKCIYSSTVLKYNFEVLEYFHILLLYTYISEGNTVLYILFHYFEFKASLTSYLVYLLSYFVTLILIFGLYYSKLYHKAVYKVNTITPPL